MSNLKKTNTYQRQLEQAAFEKYGSLHYDTTSNKIIYKPKEGIVDCKQTPKVYVWLHLLDNEEEISHLSVEEEFFIDYFNPDLNESITKNAVKIKI